MGLRFRIQAACLLFPLFALPARADDFSFSWNGELEQTDGITAKDQGPVVVTGEIDGLVNNGSPSVPTAFIIDTYPGALTGVLPAAPINLTALVSSGADNYFYVPNVFPIEDTVTEQNGTVVATDLIFDASSSLGVTFSVGGIGGFTLSPYVSVGQHDYVNGRTNSLSDFTFTPIIAGITTAPEPASFAVLATSLVGISIVRRRVSRVLGVRPERSPV